MGLRDIGETLPPGFRFYPSDEELVCHYLYKKIANEEVDRGTLVEIDLHTCEPWQLPDVAKLNSNEWYFFSFRDRKYATGYRANRATTTGYWKATGKDRAVLDPRTRATVGMRKTLVFYMNRAPNGIKTGWIMHEFRLENPQVPPKEDWVLCRVFNKSRDSTENSNKFSQNICYNPTNNTTYPTLAASTTKGQALPSTTSIVYQNITSLSHSASHHNQNQNPSTSIGLSALGFGNLNLSQHHMNVPLMEAKSEDDYGFLLGMSFEDSNGFLHSSCEDHMGLIDDDEDNGMVFV